MTRHRRDDQHLLAFRRQGFSASFETKMQQPAERPFPHDLLGHAIVGATDSGLGDAEFRLSVTSGHPLEHVERGSHGAGDIGSGQRISWIFPEEPAKVRRRPPGRHSRMIQFVEVIKHSGPPPDMHRAPQVKT
jgi:hypothetical protein